MGIESYKILFEYPTFGEYGPCEGIGYDPILVINQFRYLKQDQYRSEWYKLTVL